MLIHTNSISANAVGLGCLQRTFKNAALVNYLPKFVLKIVSKSVINKREALISPCGFPPK